MRNNSVDIHSTHGLIQFPHLTMQVRTASTETTAKSQPVITDQAFMISPKTTKSITAFVDHAPEWNTTGTVTPVDKFTKTASLLISQSISTIVDKKIAVRATNTTESPYLIKKNTQTADYNGSTISNQKEYTDCSRSGAIQAH